MEINLYSDTQTKPTAAMYAAMASAAVGDEQHGRDPTVNALCERVAALTGKQAALFLPTGTMCNVIAFLVHCRPGDEVIAHETSHVLMSEGGGAAAFAGALIRPLPGAQGRFDAGQLVAAARQPSRYSPRSRMVVIEQTANFAGGAIWPLDQIQAVADAAYARGLIVHMDGARLFNAVVRSGVAAADFCAPCDSVWIDLTKGLGCPVGAVLAGSSGFIENARVWKQRCGGAMRQAGVLAGAGLHALDHHVERLAADHRNAREFARLISAHPAVTLAPPDPETNIVIFDVGLRRGSARDVSARLLERGVRIGALSDSRLRALTHLDITSDQTAEAATILGSILDDFR